MATVGAVILFGSIAAFWSLRSARAPQASIRVVPLTTLPGREDAPSFSPDGSQVAFMWEGGNRDNWDIYVTVVGTSETRRLTTDPGDDVAPSWSPDGRQIAYVHGGPAMDAGRIRLISPLGGSDNALSDVPVWGSLAWSPNGRYVAAGRRTTRDEDGGIHLIPVQGGSPLALTRTRFPVVHVEPAFSPDGGQLAYASCSAGCDVYLIALDGSYRSAQPARRLTAQSFSAISSLVWAQDGSSIIASAGTAPSLSFLWRVAVDGRLSPERLEIAGMGAHAPAIASSRNRLAFSRASVDMDVYRFDVGRPVRPIVASTYPDYEPALSRIHRL
jgi:Tol biopolymer transport system component